MLQYFATNDHIKVVIRIGNMPRLEIALTESYVIGLGDLPHTLCQIYRVHFIVRVSLLQEEGEICSSDVENPNGLW